MATMLCIIPTTGLVVMLLNITVVTTYGAGLHGEKKSTPQSGGEEFIALFINTY